MSGRPDPHAYSPDPDLPADHRGHRPCRHCPLPAGNQVHELPDAGEDQAEHCRRVGDRS